MTSPLRVRLAALLASAAVVAGALLPAFPAAAEEPPAPEVPAVETPAPDPSEPPVPEESAALEETPAPEPTDPTEAPAPVETTAPETDATAETDEPDAGATVVYSGTAQQLSGDGLEVDPNIVIFAVNDLGFLNVDVSELATRPDSLTPVALTLRVPAGLTLKDDADARFDQLATASTVSPLVAVGTKRVKQTAERQTASLVNQTPNISAMHHVFVVYVSPKNKTTKDAAQGNNTAAQNLVTAADTYWNAQSGGTIRFTLDGVVPWYKSTYSCSTSAGSTSLWNQAMAKAKTAGFVPGKNKHLVLVFPEGAPNYSYCGGAIGLGTIGGSVNQGGLTWIMGSTSTIAQATIKHELGHNLSLGHAELLSCSSSAPIVGTVALNYNTGVISGCPVKHYGDLADVMGYGTEVSTGGALSSPQAIRAGIWDSSAWVEAPIGTDTPYTLQPVSGHTGLRAVVVLDKDGTAYFVEFRNFDNEDAYNNDYGDDGCDTNACVLDQPNVRILRFEASGFTGYPGYGSYLIRRGSTNAIGYTGAGTFWTGGGTNQGSKIEIISVGANSASIKVTRTAPASLEDEDWIVVKRTLGYDSTLRVDDTLTAFMGDWWNAESSAYSFQWQRNGVNIPSATSQSYTLTPDDVGAMIRFKVTVTGIAQTFYNVSSSSGLPIQLGPISKGIYQPEQPGSVSIDNSTTPLQAIPVDWPLGTTFTYQWYRGKTATTATTAATGAGAKTANYTPNSADVGQFLRVRVTATVPGYNPVSRYSPAKNYSITAVGSPVISGSHTVGELITVCSHGIAFSTVDGPLVGGTDSYQWFRNGVLQSETSCNYTILSKDYGQKLTVKVVHSAPGWVTFVSKASPSFVPNVKGTIYGSYANPTMVSTPVGATGFKLTATLPGGSITESGVDFAYQWYRVNRTTNAATAIKGATKVDYTPGSADYPYKLKVRVTVTKLNYGTVVLYADPVAFTVDRVTAPKLAGQPGYAPEGVPTPAITVTFGSYTDGTTGSSLVTNETFQWYRNGVAIPGAIFPGYQPIPADKGKKITVKVTQSSPGLLPSVVTLSTQPIGAGYFGGWDGPAVVTQTPNTLVLTASSGVGTGGLTGVKHTYQWYRDGSKISKATKSTYTLTASDFGKDVWVRVVTTKSGYTTAVTDSPRVDYSIQPALAGPYVSAGNWRVGEQAAVYGLSFVTKDGSLGIPPATVAYQWMRDGKAIAGATGQYYVMTASDYGKKVTARLTVTAPGYVRLVYLVPQTYKVAKGVTWADPVVNVVPGAGLGTLTATFTGLMPSTPTPAYSFQWYRSSSPTGPWSAISGAKSSTYKLTSADFEKYVTPRIVMTRTNFTVPSALLTHDLALLADDYTIKKSGLPPTISGSPVRVGETLTATPPDFFEADGSTPLGGSPTLIYTWYRNGVAISGATGANYVLTASDLNKRITVKVSANLPGRLAATSPVSAQTGVVAPGEFGGSFADPTVNVNAVTHAAVASLTAGSVLPATGNSVTYQWKRNGASISKATKSSYTLTSADTGKDVTVVIRVVRAGFDPVTLTAHANAISKTGTAIIVGEPSTATAGDVLQVAPATYSTAWGAPVTPTYQWLRDGEPITGATGSTFDTTGEAGNSISVQVSASATYHFAPPVDTTPEVAIS
ncbi:MAG: zinc-dependent metalloprotease family protein [Schumannella sp.]